MSPGPRLRTDVIDAYVFRRARAGGVELLQLHRTSEPLRATWQPVMGHARPTESAVACLWRELREETGLTRRSSEMLGAWALQSVHPYLLVAIDAIMLSPCFAVEVGRSWTPTLNAEHDGARWVTARSARRAFMWPSQHAAVAELIELARRAPEDRRGAIR